MRTTNPKRLAAYQAELACPPCPPSLTYLWATFYRLSNRRGSNGFGVNPITWSELDAFTRLSGVRLTPWEIETVEMLDDLYRAPAKTEPEPT